MNPLVRAMLTAERERWCVSTWCTTCGHRDFVEALMQIESPPHHTVASLLADVDFAELQSAPNWKDCIRSIFQRRRGPGKLPILSFDDRQVVLRCWATRLAKTDVSETLLTDFVMFYLVRNEPAASNALPGWVDQSLSVLRATKDRSLAETLVYFARRHRRFRDQIMADVFELVPTDQLVQAAVNKLAVPEGK